MTHPPTLPDYLGPGLHIVSIGINPSRYSVAQGFYFARPGNRFWPVLATAGIVPAGLEPCKATIEILFREHHIGFTDIVKRATARANELDDEEYRLGAGKLKKKLHKYQPLIAWFQGGPAFAKYLHHVEALNRQVRPGLQPERIGETRVFVSPNPSGASPAANPALLLPWYQELRRLRDHLLREARQ